MSQLLINGAMRDENEPVILADDRGFRFGDGVFETIPVRHGLPYLWDYHMQRLTAGLAALRIVLDTQPLLGQALSLIRANGLTNGSLRIHISRGTGSRGYLPVSTSPATVIIQTLESPSPTPGGIKLWLSPFTKISKSALPTQFKLAQGINSTLALMEAAEQGCDNALLLDAEGHISEAASANIFWRMDNRLFTPAPACGALLGVTRRWLLENSPYPVTEGLYRVEELAAANAVILTNATNGAIAIGSLSPNANRWQSEALAQEINALREKDIIRNTAALRESLA